MMLCLKLELQNKSSCHMETTLRSLQSYGIHFALGQPWIAIHHAGLQMSYRGWYCSCASWRSSPNYRMPLCELARDCLVRFPCIRSLFVCLKTLPAPINLLVPPSWCFRSTVLSTEAILLHTCRACIHSFFHWRWSSQWHFADSSVLCHHRHSHHRTLWYIARMKRSSHLNMWKQVVGVLDKRKNLFNFH